MPRKGENIYKRKDGRWEGRYIKGYVDRKAKYGYVYGKTYRDVKQRLIVVKSTCATAATTNTIDHQDIDFSACSRLWLSEKETTIKHSSYMKYQNLLNSYIIPVIGAKRIRIIDYDCLSELISKLLAQAGKSENGLSTKTVSDSIAVVKSVIRYASRHKYTIDTSAFDASVKVKSASLRVLSKTEQDKLIAHVQGDIQDPYNLGVLISLFTGIRIGELCALKWSDVSDEDRIISINKTLQRVQTPELETRTSIVISEPKSDCSIRQIPIPDALFNLLNSQDNKSYYVLTNSDSYIEPRTMQNHFKIIISECDISDANFHALRHTFATRCIEL